MSAIDSRSEVTNSLAADSERRQAEVAAFFSRHQIDELFSALMDRVLREQPDEPLQFLIDALRQRRQSGV